MDCWYGTTRLMNNVNKTSTGQKPKESRGRNAATVFLVGSVEGSTTGVSATARFSRPNPPRFCCRFLRGSGHIVHGGPGPEMLAARRISDEPSWPTRDGCYRYLYDVSSPAQLTVTC